MFECAEVGNAVDDETYAKEEEALRQALLEVQHQLFKAKKFPVVILVGGVDGAGKGETVNLLNEWMDPRHITTHAVGTPTSEEEERPYMWRFWRLLPPKGKIGIFFGAWHTQPILRRAYGETTDAELDRSLEDIVRFERMLHEEGVLLLKFWFHLSKKAQKKRLRSLSKDPRQSWRVTALDWKHFELYDDFKRISERAIRRTSTAAVEWTIVEGADPNFRSLAVGKAILEAVQKRLDALKAPAPSSNGGETTLAPGKNVLATADLASSLEDAEYKPRLEDAQRRLSLSTRRKRFAKKHSLVLVFEGCDAAGKGGAIRRVTGALDARQYKIVPIAAPTDEERAQPYLWRFWRHIAGLGRITIYDRSWYGRVLVERVEGFCREHEWRRAYEEINDFEEQLTRHGAVVVKFWLQIGKDEQLARFQARQNTPFKQWKITEEDWRNREKWDSYEVAVNDMIARTSTEIAPWTIVPANDKKFARVQIVETIANMLEGALD